MDTLAYAAHEILKRQNKVEDFESQDDNVASATKTSSSIKAFVATLVPSLVIFAVFCILFIILRRTNKRIYAPRSYVGTVEKWRRLNYDEHFGENGGGMFGWIGGLWRIP